MTDNGKYSHGQLHVTMTMLDGLRTRSIHLGLSGLKIVDDSIKNE